MRQASALYRLLGDEARLRLLRALTRERLNVTELTGILGLAQSGVSRHLGLLKDAGLVTEEKEAGFTYYRIAREAGDRDGAMWAMLQGEFERAAADPAVRADEARLQEVLRLRKENFETHAGPDTRDRRQLVPGRSWAAWSRALGLLLPPLKAADLGCGEGYLTIEASRWARRVALRGAAVCRTSSGSAASSRSCRSGMTPSTSPCFRRRCTTRRTRHGPWPRPRASPCRADACSCSICARTRRSGCAPSSATGASASTMPSSSACWSRPA